jgi:hypothetical protein
MNRRAALSVIALSGLLGGCSTFKKLTGQRNDTVLPGEREEILSPDNYTAKNEDLNAPPAEGAEPPPAAKTAPPAGQTCNPEVDPECTEPPPSGANKGIFNDG